MIDQWTDFKIWCLHYSQCHLSTYIASKKKHWSDMLRDFNSSSICMTDFHLSKKFYCIYFKTYIRPYCPARGLCHQSEQLFRGVNLACSGVRIGDSLQVASRWMPDPRFPSSALHYNEMININHFTCQCTMKHWQTYIMEVFLVEIGGIYLQASTLFPLGCCEARKVTFWLFYWS